MANKKSETTSAKAATSASKTLKGTGTKKDAKAAAGSALTQKVKGGKKK
jgi:hypothetical protein